MKLGNGAPRRTTLAKMTRLATLAITGAILLPAFAAHAQPVAEFYKNRRMDLVTSGSVGGGYDLYARLLARYMPRHIPGNPTITVKNMLEIGRAHV